MNDEERRERKPAKRHTRGVFEKVPGSGVWWVRYTDENGRLHREKVGPKSLARKVYEKRKTEIQERRFFPERIGRHEVFVADAIDDYLARVKDSLRVYSNYVRYGSLWKSALAGKTIRQLVPGNIERHIAKRIVEVSKATSNRELSFLRRVINVAIADGYAEANPVRAVRMFKENNQRVRFLSEEEEKSLRDALGEEQWPIIAIAINTGLRRGEQFDLCWENIDFATGLITVTRSKSGEARRIPMNDTVRAILRSRPSRLKGQFVFPSKTGETPRDARNFVQRVFLPATGVAGIENFRWHDLRHTFASRLVMAGVDLRTVQELMGHKTITMTLRYSHLPPAHQMDAVQRLVPKPTDTATDTASAKAKDATQPVAELPQIKRNRGAGDRDRTGDVQLGKLTPGIRPSAGRPR